MWYSPLAGQSMNWGLVVSLIKVVHYLNQMNESHLITNISPLSQHLSRHVSVFYLYLYLFIIISWSCNIFVRPLFLPWQSSDLSCSISNIRKLEKMNLNCVLSSLWKHNDCSQLHLSQLPDYISDIFSKFSRKQIPAKKFVLIMLLYKTWIHLPAKFSLKYEAL